MVEKTPLTKAELTRLADILLSRHGFSYDGRPKRLLQKKQKHFEKRTIITTPMGNGSR